MSLFDLCKSVAGFLGESPARPSQRNTYNVIRRRDSAADERRRRDDDTRKRRQRDDDDRREREEESQRQAETFAAAWLSSR